MTPPEILTELSRSRNSYVVRDVGANPNTPIDTLVAIAESTKDYTTLYGVAGNPNTPVEVLKQLGGRTAADWDLPREKPIWKLYQSYVFSQLARNPRSPVELLDTISHSQKQKVGAALVRNPNTTCEILKRLLDYEYYAPLRGMRRRVEKECY